MVVDEGSALVSWSWPLLASLPNSPRKIPHRATWIKHNIVGTNNQTTPLLLRTSWGLSTSHDTRVDNICRGIAKTHFPLPHLLCVSLPSMMMRNKARRQLVFRPRLVLLCFAGMFRSWACNYPFIPSSPHSCVGF